VRLRQRPLGFALGPFGLSDRRGVLLSCLLLSLLPSLVSELSLPLHLREKPALLRHLVLPLRFPKTRVARLP
jgi:hypothetical protein